MRSRSSASLAAIAMVKLDSGALRRIQPPKFVNRNAESLAGEIVERGADRRFDRAIEAQGAIHLRFHILERPRIERLDDRGQAGQCSKGRVRRFAVEPIRRGLPPPLYAIPIGDAHANQPVLASRASRDDERMGGADDRDVVLNLHFDDKAGARGP